MIRTLLARWLGSQLDDRIAGLRQRSAIQAQAAARARRATQTYAVLAERWQSIAEQVRQERDDTRDALGAALLERDGLEAELAQVRAALQEQRAVPS